VRSSDTVTHHRVYKSDAIQLITKSTFNEHNVAKGSGLLCQPAIMTGSSHNAAEVGGTSEADY